ncbi:PD-(D/E)XK nuclease family protein [Vicingaceae bacterium]|nr:PD-(D/E)XK nuclease family protein [Vicingaceae bacterium]
MQSFLTRIAKYSIKKHGDKLGNLTLVLPNRRAIVFLKEEFKKELKKASWLPQFFSLEDFIQQLGNYNLLDPTDLIFNLYKVHQEIEGSAAETFEEFMGWGSTLLQDFNEIDRYLVNAQDLYGFLTEAKALETWNVENNELTEFQHKYLRFWNKLGEYYSLFNQHLKAEGAAYQGLGFRSVAEQLAKKEEPKNKFENVIFAGFNALTEAEKGIIDYYVQEHAAETIWDADEYYLNDKFQEAGTFLRDHRSKAKGAFNWIGEDLLTEPKNITVYGVMGNIGQAKLIGNLIDANKEQETAVVLSDESLLVPCLEGLPQGISATNVTMGYPITSATVYSWLASYLDLYAKFNQSTEKNAFYHKNVTEFLQHNVQQHFNKAVRTEVERLTKRMSQEKSIFVPFTEFEALNQALGFTAFGLEKNTAVLLAQTVLQLIQALRLAGKDSLDSLNIECLAELEKSFNRLERLIQKEKELTEIENLIEIFKQIVSKQSISFVGKPLGGLQIMGVLESRTLDFENVIISSVNEGMLPSGKSQNSFIPFDIKHKFGLPSHQEKDAIFAYHFYRLLQRASNISILYNSKVDQLEGGERSRFIEQLLHEFPRKNPQSTIQEINVSPKPLANPIQPISIPLTDDIREKMRYKLEHKLSASALNLYLACPLSFYYRYVIGLKEEDSFQEKIEDHMLGQLVHESLKTLYEPLINKTLIKEDLKTIYSKIDKKLAKEFKKQLNTNAATGNHKLTFEVAKKFIQHQIQHDLADIAKGHKIVIKELEEEHSCSIPLKINDTLEVGFNLFGKIDRIDEFNGEVRIIDYKTGGTALKDLKNKKLEKLLENDSPKSVQLMLYKYMYRKNTGQDVDSGILSLKNISSGYLALDNKDWVEIFEGLLKMVAYEILADAADLQHNKESKYCSFCN